MKQSNKPGKPKCDDAFAREIRQPQVGIAKELWDFLRYNKKWWLIPIVVVLLLIAALMVLGGTAAAPFIYTLF